MKIAVFPGSFDPITKGHESIVHRALPLFDEIIIGIGNNTEKKYFFPIEKRETFIRKVFEPPWETRQANEPALNDASRYSTCPLGGACKLLSLASERVTIGTVEAPRSLFVRCLETWGQNSGKLEKYKAHKALQVCFVAWRGSSAG